MARIRSLKPNVTREEAMHQFSPGGPLDFLRQAIFGPLRSVADFYIPFRLFQVEIRNRGKSESRVFGLDAVNGSLDPYGFESLPGPDDVICLETRNCPAAVLEEAQAQELVAAKLRRILFTRGFFRIRDLGIFVEPVPGEIYIPYWVGFRGHGTQARFTVIDAVRRRVEGAKVRNLLETWLTSAQ